MVTCSLTPLMSLLCKSTRTLRKLSVLTITFLVNGRSMATVFIGNVIFFHPYFAIDYLLCCLQSYSFGNFVQSPCWGFSDLSIAPWWNVSSTSFCRKKANLLFHAMPVRSPKVVRRTQVNQDFGLAAFGRMSIKWSRSVLVVKSA